MGGLCGLPRRGYSPAIRVPQTDVTCGLSAIAVRSVCSCASIQGGGADADTTAVDRVRSHREEPGSCHVSDFRMLRLVDRDSGTMSSM
ncbi:unnamed protein product [Musa acuminata var. zebrina]